MQHVCCVPIEQNDKSIGFSMLEKPLFTILCYYQNIEEQLHCQRQNLYTVPKVQFIPSLKLEFHYGNPFNLLMQIFIIKLLNFD